MSQTAKQPDPERERKRAWLNRYRDSLAEQRRIAERLAWRPANDDISLWQILSGKRTDVAFRNLHPDISPVSAYRVMVIFCRIHDFKPRILGKFVIQHPRTGKQGNYP